MSKKAILAVALIMLLGLFASSNVINADDITIGYSTWTLDYTFFANLTEGVENAAEERGWDVMVVEADMDSSKQIADCESLLVEGIDVLIVTPVDPPAIAPAVHTAKDRGVPVVILDIGGSGPYDAFIISDNFKGGSMAGEYMAEFLHEEREELSMEVATISVQPEHEYAFQRHKGFIEAIEKEGFEVVAEVAADGTMAGGYDAMEAIISGHPDIEGVFVASGREAVGASRAIMAAGLDPIEDIVVIGFNADPEEIEAMRDDRMQATIMQQPVLMGEMSVDLAEELLAGVEMEQDAHYAPVELITPENIDEHFPVEVEVEEEVEEELEELED